MAENVNIRYADGYHEIFADSESDEEDFYGFDLRDNVFNNSSDSESEDENAANLPQAPQQDVHVGAYDHPWLRNFTERYGVLADLGNEPEESECFKAVFSDEAIAFIVIETNRYAAQQIMLLCHAGRLKEHSRANSWKETKISEMKAWLSIALLMGYVRLPNYYAYWSTDILTKQTGIRRIMTGDRFLSILQILHLCNNDEALPVGHDNHDRLFKLRTFMEDLLIPLWQGSYYPVRDISVDETWLPSREEHP